MQPFLCSIPNFLQGALDDEFPVSLSFGDPFHLEVRYSEADNEFQLDFNWGEDTTTYAIDEPLTEVVLTKVVGSVGMEINFVGVTHEGEKSSNSLKLGYNELLYNMF